MTTAVAATNHDLILAGPVGSLDAYIHAVGAISVLTKEDEQVADTILFNNIIKRAARIWNPESPNIVWIANRTCEPQLAKLIDECRRDSPESHYLAGDLGERAFAERIIDETVSRHGRIDVLVNNAAISKHKQIYHVSVEEAERVMDVN